MAKYLWQASYTSEGARGLLQEGAASRKATVEALVKGLGGSIEAFYFSFGASDVVVIVDLPGNTDAAAISMAVGASGAVGLSTTVLLTVEEADAAATRARGITYRPPGG